mmetsp:Transcript_11160/g.23527  ORF Transcript_11160/g.23527 Transcript_11160/m.23527 type:complete len:415 (+) Transcript_11160:135-1379(+)
MKSQPASSAAEAEESSPSKLVSVVKYVFFRAPLVIALYALLFTSSRYEGLVRAGSNAKDKREKDGANKGAVKRHAGVDRAPSPPITIVCQLSGEMGNNIAKWGYCLSIKFWLESGEFQDVTGNVRIVIRHQDHNKWVRGATDVKRCFPNTRGYDFGEANTDEFVQLFNRQNEAFGLSQRWSKGGPTPFDGINVGMMANRTEALRHFVSSHLSQPNVTGSRVTNITIPFLYASQFLLADELFDRYYDELRKYFYFDLDNRECCKQVPDPDEAVFHFRNFLTEMPRRGQALGFSELKADQVASDLFGHLKPGEKIAIITRFTSELAQPYVSALRARGLQVRVIEGQNGVQDFCFLMSAQKEIVGIAYSTYLFWGGILSNATRVVAYSVGSSRKGHHHYNWTNPKLRSKFDFRLVSR